MESDVIQYECRNFSNAESDISSLGLEIRAKPKVSSARPKSGKVSADEKKPENSAAIEVISPLEKEETPEVQRANTNEEKSVTARVTRSGKLTVAKELRVINPFANDYDRKKSSRTKREHELSVNSVRGRLRNDMKNTNQVPSSRFKTPTNQISIDNFTDSNVKQLITNTPHRNLNLKQTSRKHRVNHADDVSIVSDPKYDQKKSLPHDLKERKSVDRQDLSNSEVEECTTDYESFIKLPNYSSLNDKLPLLKKSNNNKVNTHQPSINIVSKQGRHKKFRKISSNEDSQFPPLVWDGFQTKAVLAKVSYQSNCYNTFNGYLN